MCPSSEKKKVHTMTDLILSVGQDTVRDDILHLRLLLKSGAPKTSCVDLWLGILALVEEEKDRYPEELHPKVFFKGRTRFGRRGPRPIVRLYLHKLNAYLTSIDSKNLPR